MTATSPHDLSWWSDPDYDNTGKLIRPDDRCECCGESEWGDNLKNWCGEFRCEKCRVLCADCRDEAVLREGEFCWWCAHQAMGVDV